MIGPGPGITEGIIDPGLGSGRHSQQTERVPYDVEDQVEEEVVVVKGHVDLLGQCPDVDRGAAV